MLEKWEMQCMLTHCLLFIESVAETKSRFCDVIHIKVRMRNDEKYYKERIRSGSDK